MNAGCAEWDRSDPDGTGYLSAADRRVQEERARNGDTEAMLKLRLHFDAADDLETSRLWLKRAANAGDMNAMTDLGRIMCNAKDLPAKKQGWQWLGRAESAGHKGLTTIQSSLRCKAEIENLERLAQEAASKKSN